MKIEKELGDGQLEQILNPYNPWWGNREFNIEAFRRPVFKKIFNDLTTLKQIISVTGPRRVGKTTILKQIAKELITSQGVNPKQVIYFSFDDPLLLEPYIKEKFFDTLIKWVDTQQRSGSTYLFLDEIQKFDKWELYLKKYYDLGFPLKFIISGSASSPIFKKSRESLLGRIKEHHLLPFSFQEFVYYNKGNDQEVLDFVTKASEVGFKLQREMLIDWQPLGHSKLDIPAHIYGELNILLDRYFVEGGFPEVWQIKDMVAKQEYLFDNQIQKVIFEDLVIATEFRKPENIKRFYLSLLEQPGQEINLEKVAGEIGASRIMLEKYLPLLEMTELVKTVPRFSKKPLKFRRGSVKGYLLDLALRNAVLKIGDKILEDKNMMGYYAENLVFNALRKFEGVIEKSFYKDRNQEVDFVVTLGGNRYLPIEVKYRDTIDDLAGIQYFVRNYNQKLGIVVTKHFIENKENNNLMFIPLSIFLLFF